MRKLSKRQSEAIRAMENGARTTPDKIGCRKDTMKSLVKRGIVKQITLTCYNRFWSYNMNYRFVLISGSYKAKDLFPDN
jgi:hypothetical protein